MIIIIFVKGKQRKVKNKDKSKPARQTEEGLVFCVRPGGSFVMEFLVWVIKEKEVVNHARRK